MGSRREARERALGLLYEAEAKDTPGTAVLDAQPIEVDEYAADVVTGVADHRDALDEIIGRHARGWTVERMPALDRTILRMASYELCHRPDVPPNVIINEAVELAKRFSTDDSGRFVNGVLAAVASEQRGA
ncbi:transcription antitermination factor NusB [Iamia sp. SCSIO 61187]|nr:transcription antitermination factor NusB [Iamia sp. SCSIO 61187]